MTANDPNAPQQVFPTLVSIEAWHDPFSDNCLAVDLCVDVAFSTAYLGAEPESPVRFSLSLKRAQIFVIMPDHPTFRIDLASVARDQPIGRGTRKYGSTKDQNFSVGAESSAGIAGIIGSIKGNTDVTRKNTNVTDLNEEIGLIDVNHQSTHRGHSWTVSSNTSDGLLKGKPWDARNKPRMKLIEQPVASARAVKKRDATRKNSSGVIVEVQCLRKDLLINAELKDENLISFINKYRRNNYLAAEQYIKNKFANVGLDLSGSISESFLSMIISRVPAKLNV